jgi:ABC-type transporter Mla subunit MlaD
VVSQLEQLAERDDLTEDEIRAIISAATRLYANASSRAGRELPPLAPDVSTTDALTLSCALLRSQDLTPFEMAMWFGRSGQQG